MTRDALLLIVRCPCRQWVLKVHDATGGRLQLEYQRRPVMKAQENATTKPARSTQLVRESEWLAGRMLLACFGRCATGRLVWGDKATGLYIDTEAVASKLAEARRDGRARELVARKLEPGELVSLDEALRRIRA